MHVQVYPGDGANESVGQAAAGSGASPARLDEAPLAGVAEVSQTGAHDPPKRLATLGMGR